MKSKTSCFNRTIFLKNFSLFWPIWTTLLVINIVAYPLSLWTKFRGVANWYEQSYYAAGYAEAFAHVFDINGRLTYPFIVPLVVAVALFYYLYPSRTANMLHSFPVTRKELFITNLVSGLVMLLAPLFIADLLSIVICLFYGVTYVQWIALYFLYMVILFGIFFSIAVFAAMLTGQIYAVPVFYLVINLLYEGLRYIIGNIIPVFAIGISYGDVVNSYSNLILLSPMYYLKRLFRMNFEYDFDLNQMNCYMSANRSIYLYSIFALVLFFISFQVYKRRNLENAGNLLTIKALKPVLRWGAGFCIGAFGALVSCEDFSMLLNRDVRFIFVFIYYAVGVVTYFVVETMIQRSIHIVNKKSAFEFTGFACFMLLAVGIMAFHGNYISKQIPNAEDIEYAVISHAVSVEYQDEELQEVIDFHDFVVKNRNEISTFAESSDKVRINVFYALKNGERIRRSYELASNELSKPYLNRICEKEVETENFLRSMFGTNYQNITVYGANLSWIGDNVRYDYIDQIDAKAIYEAVLLDAKEGTVQKYNLYDSDGFMYSMDDNMNSSGNISIEYKNLDSINTEITQYGIVNQTADYSNEGVYSINLEFGIDCKHIVEALMEKGLIKSPEDLLLIDVAE